ncbi:MAG: LysR family transcriptional regulator [Beijerinckiaceae bacterium]|nr:LysR family transcriptional regulator [Beijerinckiaceae bacterium]
MELRQLEYFLTVVASGSFSRASSVLGVAQPALSRRIRQLEEEVGVTLFYRHGRGIRLTEEGAQFQSIVAPLTRGLAQAAADLRASSGVPAGEVSFGMPPSVSATIGGRVVRDFRQRFPQVRLQLMDAFSGTVNEWLVSGRIDMAVINAARSSPYLSMDLLMSVDLFVLARRDVLGFPADEAEPFPLSRLPELSLILPGRHHGMRRQLDSAAQRHGVELNIIVEIDALSALKELVRGGMGATVLPHGAILADALDPELIVRRLDPPVTQQMMLAFSLERPMTVAMRELSRVVKREIHAALADGRLLGRVE